MSKLDNFITKSKLVHGEKYDYSESVFVRTDIKLIIKCLKHGKFEQLPYDHIRGRGCIRCAGGGARKKTTEEFVEDAVKVHGTEKYDYSQVAYSGTHKDITIICKTHGQFIQRPHEHLAGSNCPKCMEQYSPTTEEFIEKAKEVHEGLYEYPNAVYVSNKINLEIFCLKCNKPFKQTPAAHISGHGCQKCAHSFISKKETKWFDSFNIPNENRQFKLKVGNHSYRVDAYIPEINTVYEFLGDYWHGNPNCYKAEHRNRHNKKLFSDLYKETIERLETLKLNGFKVVYKWESEKDEKIF